jgi:hypothetical protein
MNCFIGNLCDGLIESLIMSLLELPVEILLLIVHHLNGYDKCQVFGTCRKLNDLQKSIFIDHRVLYAAISNHRHYDSFRNIVCSDSQQIVFPKSLRELMHPYPIPIIPSTVRKLTLEQYAINLPYKIAAIPYGITHMVMHDEFNSSLQSLIPKSVTHFTLGYYYNQPITENDIPESVTHLTFGGCFNSPIIRLPNGITHITFGNSFHQPLPLGCIPNTVTHLTLGRDFNNNIDNLPNSIKVLKLGKSFCQIINYLPSGLESLSLAHPFTNMLHDMPSTLKHLILRGYFVQGLDNLPDGLMHLVVGKYQPEMHKLPSCLKYLTLSDVLVHQIDDILPEGLIELTFGMYYDNPINRLPLGLKKIVFGVLFNQCLNSCIPNGCEHLEFGDGFNQPIMLGDIPPTIKYLSFGRYFNQSIAGVLPDSIETLVFGECFNQNINGILPRNLKSLTLGYNFKGTIVDVPVSLSALSITEDYPHPISHLSSRIKTLTVELGLMGDKNSSMKPTDLNLCVRLYSSVLYTIPHTIEHLILYSNRYYNFGIELKCQFITICGTTLIYRKEYWIKYK